jgi:DNA-binding NtrC family response regulator
MLSILLVGGDPASLAGFAAELAKKDGIGVSSAASKHEVWQVLGSGRVDVVVVDRELADGAALPFIREMTRQYPLINCAMVSSLSPEDFHEMTEGLGIFMQLPVGPGAGEAVRLLRLLESIDALLAK